MDGGRSARRAARWAELVDRLYEETAAGSARARVYWAQQLAYGPVLVHALALRWRRQEPVEPVRSALLVVLQLARAGLGALPDRPGTLERDVARLGERQSRALGRGRRRLLDRLCERLGGVRIQPGAEPEVPAEMLRAYPLIGWDAGEVSSTSSAGGDATRDPG